MIKMDLLQCFNCGYKWFPRTKRPRECPNCKTRNWKEKRKLKEEKKNVQQ